MNNFLRVSRSAVLTVLVLITVALQGVMGQVASYTFANSAGTYTALTGGTTWQSGVTVSTNAISGDIPIGFTFRYNNQNYTNIRISNNGFIVFGNQSPSTTNYTPISLTSNSGTATNGYDGAISGFGCNLLASAGAPTIIYGASGSDFVVQFTQMARSLVTTDRITFQIRLTQTTNVISIVYGACTGSTSTTIQPQVGLRGASYFDGKRLTGTTGTTWTSPTVTDYQTAAIAAGTMRYTTTATAAVPVSGRTYTFTPPASLGAPVYAALPATENFDAAPWSNGNALQDLPNASNWRTWPSHGDRSWRRQNVAVGANSGWASVSGVITIAAPASGGAATFNNYDACATRTGYMDYHVDFSPTGTKSLTFDFRSLDMASLRIYVSTDGGATFGSAVATYATVANWTSQTAVVLGASTSSTVVVRFEATSAYNNVNTNLGIDNVSITNASCGQPSTLSSSSLNYTTATINWVAPSGSPSGYEYEVRTSGAAGSGATGLVANGTTTSAVTANITGLTGATAYTYYVRTNCGGTYSSWSSSTFTTLSCNVPTGVGSSAVATTTATISWTAPAVGSPTGYQWEVRSSNAAGSGATGLAGSGSTTSPTVTANVTGLTASTAYSIYVRTNCATGLNSAWTTAATFTSACASISAYPFTETFEAASSSRSCWQVNGYVTGTSNWTYATGAGAGIITTAQGGTVNARFVSVVGVNSPITKLISPIFNLTSLTNPRVRFWYGQEFWSPDQNTTRVYYRISPTDSWVEIANYTGNVSTWTEVILALPNPSATYQIAFEGRNNEGRANVIDNVVVEESPSCIVPTALVSSNIAATSATISWTAASPAPGSGYHYYVSTSATAPTAGTTPTGTTAAGVVTANLTGLTANTTYYYWVRSNCNGVDFSTWAGSSTFYTGYCLVSSTSTLTRITNFSTTLGITNISNLSSGQSAGGYGNFTGLSASQVPSSTVNFTLTHNETFDGAGVSVWINWNNDLDFNDVNEQIAVTAGWNYSPFTGTITVPAGTVPGNYRMRIRVDYDNLAVASCGNIATGEAEDYTFSVVAPPTCLAPTALTLGAVTATTATISWTAASPAPGSGYHYYVSTSATAPTAGTTPTGTTAAGVVTANLTGLTANTTYYYWVRSNCDGVDFSTWAGSGTFFTGYCVSTATGGVQHITNFVTTGGATNIGNASGAWSATGYGNFSAQSVSGPTTQVIGFTGTWNTTGGVGFGVWVDWNDDLDFLDANEQCYLSAAYNYTTSYTGSFTVPSFASLGDHRMRIRMDYNSSAPNPCSNITTGETEDYTFSVTLPPACAAQPTALSSSAVTATTATISWTAASPAPGSGYHYYVSTSATAPTAGTTPTGTTAAGVVTANLTGLTANTTYYYWVRSNCDGVDFSTWAGSGTFYTGYCLVSITNSDFTGITNVTFNTINNTSVGDPAVTDFTAVSTTVAQGSAYTLSTRVNTDGNWTVNSKAWIDWNQNTVFDVPSEEYNLGSATNTANGITSLTPSVTVPVGAVVGTTYMRVGAVEDSDPAPTACGNPLLFGEYEMYTIVVIAGTNCSGAPSAGTAPAATNVCSGGTTTLTVTGATTGSGISYQWEEWNGSAWVSAVGGSGAATTSYTTPALTVGKQYRFTVLCTPSSQSASTTGITITVGTPANDACATAQAITVGAAAITGSVACAAAGSGGCGGTSDYDVWYSFTVGSTADYKISLLPSASFDGVFQLYNGCGGSLVTSPSNSVLSTTSCIDGPFEGGLEFANYNLTSGTYYIRVYDYNGSGTAYPSTTTFTLEVVIPVSACDAPTNIASCGTNINTVIASGAGDWSGYYDCTTLFYDLLGKESVFTYTPAVTSSAYTLTVNSLSPSGTVNYINFLYKASTCSAVGVWNCIDERNGTGTTLPFSMTAGVTYYFLLKPELTTGYTINWRIDCPPAPPVNDACANATPLPCGTTNLAGTTVASVSETVSIGCTMSPFGVWYSFVGNGFSTTVSSTATFDHEMGIASGSCGALVNIACRDAAASGSAETHTFTTAVGVTYYVYIGHWSSASTITGTFTISRTCTVNEWTGNALNTDWATNGNWSTGTAPTSSGTAYIPTSPAGANFPTIDEAAQIATLTLATGATLNIQTGNSMTVTGVLTNNGTISVANGGSLVQGTGSTLAGSGTFNVSRNGSSVYDFWSSPITSVSPSFLSGTVYGYNPASGTADPSDDAFDPGWVGAGGSMVAGKGYAAYGAGTKTFTGTANNGDITIGVTSHASPNVSYNLIGNPYPSGVNVSTFLSTNSARLAVGSVYLWDDPGTTPYVTGDYAVRNALSGTAGGGGNAPTGVLGTAQGFKVNVNGNGTIQFTNAMRAASNTANIFRQSETQLLWLNAISADNRFNQTLVGFAEDGTDGNDWGYDAPKLNALGELSLYSYMDGEPLAIQGYGPFEQERIVPLGLNSDYQTVVTISLDSTENMDVEDIILEDRYYGLFHDLRVSSYVFQSAPMLYGDRFFLHFAPQMVTGIISNTVAPEVQSYIANDMLNLRSNSRITGILQMFDMSGKMVLETSNVTLGTELLSMDVSHLAKGVYSVRIQDSKKAHVQKVIK